MLQRAKCLETGQGGDGKWGGVSMHEEMHKFKWVSVKHVDRVGVCLIFERMLFQG